MRPPPARQAAWLRSRHIVGVVEVTRVTVVGDGSPLARSANRVREVLARGARTMDPVDRSLYLGFVVGDDRAQPPELVDTFRQAGLGHLSAVSGQNVALALAVVAPVLRRLSHRARWAATVGVIAWFTVLTRFEPSVLRASVMAALAATAVLTGRPIAAVAHAEPHRGHRAHGRSAAGPLGRLVAVGRRHGGHRPRRLRRCRAGCRGRRGCVSPCR